MKEKCVEILKNIKNEFIEIGNEFKNIVEYSEKRTFLLLMTFIILIVCHGYLLFNSNVGIDTDVFVNNPTNNYNWMEIGRFGLILEKNILNLKSTWFWENEALKKPVDTVVNGSTQVSAGFTFA